MTRFIHWWYTDFRCFARQPSLQGRFGVRARIQLVPVCSLRLFIFFFPSLLIVLSQKNRKELKRSHMKLSTMKMSQPQFTFYMESKGQKKKRETYISKQSKSKTTYKAWQTHIYTHAHTHSPSAPAIDTPFSAQCLSFLLFTYTLPLACFTIQLAMT